MRKAIAVITAFVVSLLALTSLIAPAAAQDDRLDARPGDFRLDDGEVDIVGYLGASAALLTAPGIVPGQEIEITVEGFEDGDTVLLIIGNPATSLGTFEVQGNAITVTIPDDYREGYAEILASSSNSVSDRDGAVSVAAVYVTASGVEITTTELELSVDTALLVSLSTEDLADTGRESIVFVGFAAVVVMLGLIFLDISRGRDSKTAALVSTTA